VSRARQRKQIKKQAVYPLFAGLITVTLIIATFIVPERTLVLACVAVGLITLCISRYHYLHRRVSRDIILEYVLVLIAALFVLLGAIQQGH